MARSVNEIKKVMTDSFMTNETVIDMYNIQPGDTFDNRFSKVSLENILFYVVAFCVWTLEVLFDTHKTEVENYIDSLRPHTLRWYAEKAKMYQHGRSLDSDSDVYDNTGFTDEQIEAMKVVKYAAATETGGAVNLKVATGDDSNRQPLGAQQLNGFEYYISRVKDAGVIVNVINEPANIFDISIDIYYNPMILNENLERIDGNGDSVKAFIAKFVENLPFNGEFRNSALIDALSHYEGIEFVNFKGATCDGEAIEAYITPSSGYFKTNELNNITAVMYDIQN
ncbi:MAG: hypothetical protein LBQ28_09140 [Prevotellaceae bacterium]|jgi:hypothetical protein|nr:hypothetical protein [Prevotellaceae bacterium]